MKKLLFILCMVITTSAMADWSVVGFNSKTKEPSVAIDYARSFKTNNILYIWWKDFSYGHLSFVDRPLNHPIDIYRTQIDCRTRMMRTDYLQLAEVKHFYATPEIYQPAVDTSRTEWYVPDIGSTHEFVVNTVCKK